MSRVHVSQRWWHAGASVSLLVALYGCTVGPNYHEPNLQAPSVFDETQSMQTLPPSTSPVKWWEIFGEAELNSLEETAQRDNRDLRMAVARIDQADAMRRAVASYRYPTIVAQPSVGRTREAQNRPNNGNTNGKAATYNDIQLPLTMSYEVDVWGRIRRQVEAARANQQASEDDADFIRLTVAASVATDYLSIREADSEIKIITDVEADLQRGYDVTLDQFHKGIVSELPVKQAQSILEQAHAQLQSVHLRRDQAEHGIALVCGAAPEGFHVTVQQEVPAMPGIPAIPATMLNRRADVQAAERRLAASSAQIGAAKAAYYPQFNLTGLAGFESVSPSSLFSWENSIASLAASAATPLFNGGRTRANVDQAKAQYREGLAAYEKSVLAAYGDVEDQLAAIRYLSGQSQSRAGRCAKFPTCRADRNQPL